MGSSAFDLIVWPIACQLGMLFAAMAAVRYAIVAVGRLAKRLDDAPPSTAPGRAQARRAGASDFPTEDERGVEGPRACSRSTGGRSPGEERPRTRPVRPSIVLSGSPNNRRPP